MEWKLRALDAEGNPIEPKQEQTVEAQQTEVQEQEPQQEVQQEVQQ